MEQIPENNNSQIPPKFCKDCENILVGPNRYTLDDYLNARCGAVQNKGGQDLVSGQQLFIEESCHIQRSSRLPERCGPEGRWFKLYTRPLPSSSLIPITKQQMNRLNKGLDIGLPE